MIAELFLMADRPNQSGWLGVRPTSLISAFSDSNTRQKQKRSGLFAIVESRAYHNADDPVDGVNML